MSGSTSRGRPFVQLAIAISALLLVGWIAWIANQPACGAPGSTRLAAADRWVPWGFVIVEFALPTIIGLARGHRRISILRVVVSVGTVTVLGGGLIDLVRAAYIGHCFA